VFMVCGNFPIQTQSDNFLPTVLLLITTKYLLYMIH